MKSRTGYVRAGHVTKLALIFNFHSSSGTGPKYDAKVDWPNEADGHNAALEFDGTSG